MPRGRRTSTSLVKAGCTNAMLATEILNLPTVLGLLLDRDSLAFTESGLPHRYFLHHTHSMVAEVSDHHLSAMGGSLLTHRVPLLC